MRQAGVTDPMHTGGGLAGAGAGGPSMGERIQQAVPGTHAYEATHGMTGAHRGVEQMKAAIPGACGARCCDCMRTHARTAAPEPRVLLRP